MMPMAVTRPFEDDLKVAAGLLARHTNALSVWFYRLCQWRMRDPNVLLEFKDSHRDRRQKFMEETFAIGLEDPLREQYDAAVLETPLAERGEWAHPTWLFLSQSYTRTQAIIWYSIATVGGGILDLDTIAEKYGLDRTNVSRQITKFKNELEAPGIAKEKETDVPQPLDYESPLAVSFYGKNEVAYYLQAKARYEENNFDLEHPIVADLVHQLIVNSYQIQRLQKRIEDSSDGLQGILKQIENVQDASDKLYKQLIGVQTTMGKMGSSQESLSALKANLEEARRQRDRNAEEAGIAAVAAANLENNPFLAGTAADGGVN